MPPYFVATAVGLIAYSYPAFWLGFLILLFFKRDWRVVCLFMLGLLYVFVYQHCLDLSKFPKKYQGQTLEIRGKIESLVQQKQGLSEFSFNSRRFGSLKLSWFSAPNRLSEGSYCHLTVRLKSPHSFNNPGGFNEAQYLKAKNIRATGYVKFGFCHFKESVRSLIQKKLEMTKNPMIRFIEGLTVGVRSHFTEQDWQVLRRTGTNHLFVIAGLHIGFVSGLVYLLFNFLWRRFSFLMLKMPAQQAASIAALIVAFIYASLSGFSIPTQRALIMMSVFLLAFIFKRKLVSWHAWSLALVLVLCLNPFSVYLSGFWLSFLAVAIIIYCFSGRIGQIKFKWLKLQLFLSITLVPLGFWFFGQTSLIAPFANIIVVPIVGFLIVPLSLIALPFLFVQPHIASTILAVACYLMKYVWCFLTFCSNLPFSNFNMVLYRPWELVCLILAMLLVFAPRPFPLKRLSVIFILPIFFFKPSVPSENHFKLSVLDVGEGLCMVIQTKRHTIKYGCKNRDGEILKSYLKQEDIQSLSHLDGQSAWRWDGVQFKKLGPMLKVVSSSSSLLIVGDMIARAQSGYLGNSGFLKSDILIVPRHGALSGFNRSFLKAVSPSIAIISAGFDNRFHHPSSYVVKQYRLMGIRVKNTAVDGAVVLNSQ